jgi:hypothetical protein
MFAYEKGLMCTDCVNIDLTCWLQVELNVYI